MSLLGSGAYTGIGGHAFVKGKAVKGTARRSYVQRHALEFSFGGAFAVFIALIILGYILFIHIPMEQ